MKKFEEQAVQRFSDCSVLFYQSFITRKDQEILKLREQVDRISNELQVRDQRSMHQKIVFSNKLAVLEFKIEEINRQNRELSQQLVKSEVQLQRFKREQEQNASKVSKEVEIQIINLRKQLIITQQLARQVQHIKDLEIINFRHQILLKENQINHILQEKKMLSNKLSHIMGELSSEKDEKTRKIQELIENLQSLKKDASAQKKNLQKKLQNSEQAILNLQNLLQERVHQIKLLTKKQQAEVKVLQENFQAEKLKISDEKRQQIKSLKQALESQEGAVLKIKRMEAEYSQKEMELKMHKLEGQQSTAIINLKLQFLKKRCFDKDSKITKLQEQSSDYLNMFVQKNNELANLHITLDESRNLYETLQFQLSRELEKCNQQLRQKIREIAQLEKVNQRLTYQLREKQQQNRQLAEKLKIQIKTSEEKIKQLNDRLTWSQGQSQAKISQLQSKPSQKGLNYSKQIQELKAKHKLEHNTLKKEIQSLKSKNSDLQEQKSQAIYTLKMDILELKQKINDSEHQKQALTLKIQKEENQREFNIVTNQLKKASEKASDDSQTRKLHSDKKYTDQIQLLKESLRSKCYQYQGILRKQMEQIRLSKQKNNELLQALEKLRTENLLLQNYRKNRQQFIEFLDKVGDFADLQYQQSENLKKSITELKKSQSYFG